jgi:hypothetical protein
MELVPLSRSLADGFTLALRGDPGVSYFVEFSSDLQSWTASALTTDAAGTVLFRDSSQQQFRFYRARLVQ